MTKTTAMKISGSRTNAVLYANGKRCGVYVMGGPWVAGVNQATIKITPKKYAFPAEIKAALASVIENNSDIMTDYFESDTIRILPGHPLYESAKAATM